jgi:hypothetical protein
MTDEEKAQEKLEKLLWMILGRSTKEEKSNAVGMLPPVLAILGFDIGVLIERVARGGDDKLSAGEMQEIHDAAYAKGYAEGADQGRRSAVIAAAMPMKIADTSDIGPGVNGYSWLEIAKHCALNRHLFSGKEQGFIDDMPEKIVKYGRPTPPQAKWLGDIFNKRFGGTID